MTRKIALVALAAVLSLVLATAASATHTTSINNGGNTPSCGASCDQSHNSTDYTKPCDPVPGNGCHQLPDTPCERGHGGTEIGNKHCGPDLTILKEQSTTPGTDFTHDVITAPLNKSSVYYRITVTNNTSTAYTLVASDPLCDNPAAHALVPSGPQTLAALGNVVYTCDIDVIGGAGDIPTHATPGGGPYTLTNTVTVVATPVGGGSPVTLTDTVSASVN